jgi:hypothetical protein
LDSDRTLTVSPQSIPLYGQYREISQFCVPVMSDNWAESPSRPTRPITPNVIVVEQPAETLTTAKPVIAPGRRRAVDEFIAESLRIAFAMVVLDELVQGLPEVVLAHRNHAVETFQ